MKTNLQGMKKHDLTQFMQRQTALAMEKVVQEVAVQILHSAGMVPKDAAALDRITKALITQFLITLSRCWNLPRHQRRQHHELSYAAARLPD